MPNEIPVVCHNDSNYDYNFIIKESTNVSDRRFECLGENTGKYKTFVVPIEKVVTKIDKYGIETVVTICCKIWFIDSARFMAGILSNIVDNLVKGIHLNYV